jgi:hypothetical protein
MPSQMRFSPDGERLVIGSWGGTFPEVHVFDRSESLPIFTLDTPGSMFDVEVVRSPGGDTYVTACGKDVHAGTGGRGGDLYAIEIPGDGASAPEESQETIVFGSVSACPNPFRSQTRVAYSLAEPGPVKLSVYDLQGRLVRSLLEASPASGERSLVWNGRDDLGRPVPSGVYFLQMASGRVAGTTKVLFLEE